MIKMKCLDLCCCAGGASDGYAAAGFEVTGVDFKQQRNYPYPFHKLCALEVLDGKTDVDVSKFDFIHASPPCQSHTSLKHIRDAQGNQCRVVDILEDVVDRLVALGKPFIVENVVGATVEKHELHEVMLCGSMFGLKVRRHRKFWSNVPLKTLRCDHKAQGRPVGVYGRMNDHVKGMWKGKMSYGGKTAKTLEEAKAAMGTQRDIPWAKLKEAIPPAYSKFLGKQIIKYINKKNKK